FSVEDALAWIARIKPACHPDQSSFRSRLRGAAEQAAAPCRARFRRAQAHAPGRLGRVKFGRRLDAVGDTRINSNSDFCAKSGACGVILELSNIFHNISYANSRWPWRVARGTNICPFSARLRFSV